jgi:hypothetical protein
MSAPSWLDDLHALTARFSGYGITPDLAALTLAEACGLYVFLHKLAAAAEGAANGG